MLTQGYVQAKADWEPWEYTSCPFNMKSVLWKYPDDEVIVHPKVSP
jgi:hypothetical protein